MRNKRDVIVIGGPTASGKSWAAATLAARRGGVVINADSMQLYDALPILSAAPDAAMHALAPHCLYGILESGQTTTAAEWSRWARAAIEAALDAHQLPIVVGGTGLYLEALVEGLSDIPAVPENVRATGRVELAAMGSEAFHARLVAADPASVRLPPGDTHRILRAWEVLQATGQPLSAWQSQRVPAPAWTCTRIAIVPPREALYRGCDERLERMLARGALDELAALRDANTEILPVMRTLGARPMMDHLERRLDLATALTQAQAATRHYAKRQTTWFRNRFMRGPGARLVDSADNVLTAV